MGDRGYEELVGEFRRRSRSLEREEFDDLVQECLAHWIVVRRKLAPDPDAPPVGYMAQVIRNKLTDLIRGRRPTSAPETRRRCRSMPRSTARTMA